MKINHKLKTIIITILGCVHFFKPAFGQEIILSAFATDSTDLEGIINVAYTINADADTISVKGFENFVLISGPVTYGAKTCHFQNGKLTEEYRKSFSYELKPTIKGKFIIPEACVNYNGTKYYSKTLTIIVTDNLKTKKTEKEVYLDLSFSKKEVFINEPVVATVNLISKYPVSEINNYETSVYNDFLSYDLNEKKLYPRDTIINGVRFVFITVEKKLLYPLKEGLLSVSMGKLMCKINKFQKPEKVVHTLNKINGPNYFFTVERKVEINSKAITVKSLPAKAPANFIQVSGTNIQLIASLNKTNVKNNAPFIYEIKFKNGILSENKFAGWINSDNRYIKQ